MSINQMLALNNCAIKSSALEAIQEGDALSFYPAYRQLAERLPNLSYVEFALFVFDGDLRLFEKHADANHRLQPLYGHAELTQIAINQDLQDENIPFNSGLLNYSFAKADIERFIPEYRYIGFSDACHYIAHAANISEGEAKNFLLHKAKNDSIFPDHPYYGIVQAQYDESWENAAYPDYLLKEIVEDDFGIVALGAIDDNFSSESKNSEYVQADTALAAVKPNQVNTPSKPDKRRSQLHQFIWRVYLKLKSTGETKITAHQLWNEIRTNHKQYDVEEIIQEVTAQKILWCSQYGNEQTQLRSTFRKTLSKLKKYPPF